MFYSISGTLDKRKKDLVRSEEKSSDISVIFDKFLNDYFAEYKSLFKWKISYNSKDRKVTVDTGSKLVAGELSLKIKELSQRLKESNLKVTQIIIV